MARKQVDVRLIEVQLLYRVPNSWQRDNWERSITGLPWFCSPEMGVRFPPPPPILKGENVMAIKTCNCKNDYQDKKYGKNQRIHNKFIKDGGGYRCTVCNKDKT